MGQAARRSSRTKSGPDHDLLVSLGVTGEAPVPRESGCTSYFAGAGSGVPKFTLGTVRDPSDASK